MYHYIYSYYVEHYVSLASAGPSQTRVGRIAISHYLHLAFFTMLVVPCMSVMLLPTEWPITVHMYRCKNAYTCTVKLHSDMFQWWPPPSPGRQIHRTEDTDIWRCLSYHAHIDSFRGLFNTQFVYVPQTSQFIDNNFILSVQPAVQAGSLLLHNWILTSHYI
jgi:hypothetical protein